MGKCKIVRYQNGRFEWCEDDVITETRVSIRIQGSEIAGLMALPDAMDKLAAGYLYGEGFIAGPDDISKILVDEKESSADVFLREGLMVPKWDSTRKPTIGSSRGLMQSPAPDPMLPVITAPPGQHSATILLGAMNQLSLSSPLFRTTGGVHTAGLWHRDGFLWAYDDIGRHNAADKVIGHALLELWPTPADTVLVSTGRISCDIVGKVIRARIPVLVSRSAPTGLAIRMAGIHGLTVIGFARQDRCVIYTHPERILPV